jgi:nucleoid DNA-binding protein
MMNKSDLIKAMGKETGLSKTKAMKVVEPFFG